MAYSTKALTAAEAASAEVDALRAELIAAGLLSDLSSPLLSPIDGARLLSPIDGSPLLSPTGA